METSGRSAYSASSSGQPLVLFGGLSPARLYFDALWRLPIPWLFTVALGIALFCGGIACFVISLLRLNEFFQQADAITGKIAALRAGQHTAPLALPEGSRAVPAADLNALEEGIQARVEQQMKAERLKLSHDQCVPRPENTPDQHHQLCGASL